MYSRLSVKLVVVVFFTTVSKKFESAVIEWFHLTREIGSRILGTIMH